ncbi:glycerate kinase [Coriobacterium glomerans PW2]|uniref:Glycerate kinase n=2 Tax=Coriobacterium TaxID=33870 RepID=F2N8R1_CORGP|nr:glycerate kinase [Coriobacterium glomerans PW2]
MSSSPEQTTEKEARIDMRDCSVLLAVDSFKGSASSSRVESLIEQGIRRIVPSARILKFPIADGGEGTVEAIVSARGGKLRRVCARGPLGETVEARYGIVEESTAIVEMAETSGITLIEQTPRNALSASSWGVGQIIIDAIEAGCKRILIGLGGSATSDGGMGMAKALGIEFLDSARRPVPCGLEGMRTLASIDVGGLDPRIAETEFTILTDVDNPLTGQNGALRVYGPQKGIEPSEIETLDGWMSSFAALLETTVGKRVQDRPGAGAAGGLGAALMAFCDARVERGIDYVLDAIELEDAMADVDLVITGEGRIDAQSANGKAPVGVAARAKRRGKPVIAIAGGRGDDIETVYAAGIDLVLPTVPRTMGLDEAIARVDIDVPAAGETAMRAFLLSLPQVGTSIPPRVR